MKICTGSCLGYDTTVPSKFMVGTSCGQALVCSRKIQDQVEPYVKSYPVFSDMSMVKLPDGLVIGLTVHSISLSFFRSIFIPYCQMFLYYS